jgi:hydrogenase nickel incorporation protein HypA/HybF
MILIIPRRSQSREFWKAKTTHPGMHELSIIHGIIETAETVVREHGDQYAVSAIDLQIGELAGVEIDSILFLWPAAVAGTALEQAELRIDRVSGAAGCNACNTTFEIAHFSDPCPQCGTHLIQIVRGEELRIKSLELESAQPSTSQPAQQCVPPVDAAATAIN